MALDEELSRILASQTTTLSHEAPTFGGLSFSGDILRINCGSDGTLNWLRHTIASQAWWNGALLEVVQVDRLPKLTKATLFIPGKPDETEVVLRRLRAQNPWARVECWLRFHDAVKEEPIGRLFVFGVGEEDCVAIRSKGGKLSYKFSSLAVRLHGPQGETGTPALPVGTPREVPAGEAGGADVGGPVSTGERNLRETAHGSATATLTSTEPPAAAETTEECGRSMSIGIGDTSEEEPLNPGSVDTHST